MADIGLLVCATCAEIRYRSTRPLEPTEQLDPAVFAPATEETPPVVADRPPDCYLCGSKLNFVWNATLQHGARPNPGNIHFSNGASAVKVLWQVESGEEIKSMHERPTGTIIVTNRRIVEVSF